MTFTVGRALPAASGVARPTKAALLSSIMESSITRFQNNELLYLAGITEDGQHCIRPLSAAKPGYLSFDLCKKLNVLPGTILDGTFTVPQHIDAPHVEDRRFSNLRAVGTVESAEFQSILEKSSTTSIKTGFGCASKPTDKVLTIELSINHDITKV